jgi:hypothetical protein
VFDSPRVAGRFTFRFWVNDRTPPTARLLSRTARGAAIVRITDAGAGIDPRSLRATLDGRPAGIALTGNAARIDLSQADPGTRLLVFSVSDYQESKNTENIARVLPNTRVLRTTITVR